MWIETESPPCPIPLTVGCMLVIFSGPGLHHNATDFLPEAPYPNPRIKDPCPALNWPKMAFPTKEQNVALLTALSPLAHIRAILYLPSWTVVDLSYGDGHTYEPRSLPGLVAGRTTLYHHGPEPFYTRMQKQTRSRYIDPLKMLVSGDMIEAGSWSEVNGMSSGLINLMAIGRRFEAPVRPPPGHPVIPFEEWKAMSVNAIFGGINPVMSEGICGAPVLQCETGEVVGIFHLSAR